MAIIQQINKKLMIGDTEATAISAATGIINLAIVPNPTLINEIAGWGGLISVVLQLGIKIIPQIKELIKQFKEKRK